MVHRRKSLWLLVLILGGAAQLHAQLSAKDVLTGSQFPLFARFSVSPDSTLVAYTAERTRLASNTHPGVAPAQNSELLVTDLRTGQTKIVCCEEGSALLPSWSPDGKLLAFYRSEVHLEFQHWEAFVDHATLSVWNLETEKTELFLESKLGAFIVTVQPIWREDSRSLLVLTRPKSTGEMEKATETREGSTSLSNPKIRVLSTFSGAEAAAHRRTEKIEYPCARSDASRLDLENGSVQVVLKHICPIHYGYSADHRWFAFFEPGPLKPDSFFEEGDVHLLSLDRLGGRTIFSKGSMYAGQSFPFAWSPDGRYLSFPNQHRHQEKDAESVKAVSDYIVVDLRQGSVRRVEAQEADDWVSVRKAAWSSDGEYLSMIRNNALETWSLQSMTRVSKIPLSDRDLLDITASSDGDVQTQSGQEYTVIVKTKDKETKQVGFWRIRPVVNKYEKLLEDNKAFSFYTDYDELLPDRSGVLFVWESADRIAELYRADATFNRVKRITNLGSWLDGRRLGQAQLIRWKGRDGRELKGALLAPPDYRPGQRYPLIVDVYPEDARSDLLNRFGLSGTSGAYANWQLFAGQGYAVLIPDVHTTPNTRMHDIAESVLSGTKRLIDLGIADPQRIAVIGQSDGGYATLTLLVQSKLFKAAVMVSGYGNLLGSYSYDYGRTVIRETYGLTATPWHDREVLIENSPYFLLDRVQTPLLIIAGSTDAAVPPHLGEEVFSGLRELGKDAVYVEYDGEGHDPQLYSYENQLDLVERISEWFDRYVKGAVTARRASSPPPRDPH